MNTYPKNTGTIMADKKEQYSNEAQAKKNELQKEIEDIARNYSDSPQKLAELAAFRSKFYNYSFKNTMLIYSQNPGASFVGSYAKFKSIGQDIAIENGEFDEAGKIPYFGVKAGEKGMKIFVPVQTTLICINKQNDEWVQLSKATVAQKQAAENGTLETKNMLSFRLGTVFDISQTLIPAKYYPQIYSVGYTSEHHAQIFEGLKAYIENELQCPVKIEIDNSISLRGFCYTSEHTKGIGLNNKLEDTQKLSTLSHELGHFFMHRGNEADEKPSAQCEVEADIYNIMLNSHFGIETNDIRKAHLADSFREYQSVVEQSSDVKAFDTLETFFANAGKAFSDTIQDIDLYVQAHVSEAQNTVEQIVEEEITFEA